MIKAKKTIKSSHAFALEVQFTSNGYELLWDNRNYMSAVEYRFFCDYIKNSEIALLYFGAVSQKQLAKCSPSLRVLHSLSTNFLRTAARLATINELSAAMQEKLDQMMPRLKDSSKIPPESIKTIYRNLISTVAELTGENKVCDCAEKMYTLSVAALTLSFSIEEVMGNKEAPFRLLVTCNNAGNELPLREACANLGNIEKTLPIIAAPIRRISKYSNLIKVVYNDGNVLDSFALSQDEMYTFLKELELYTMMGVMCKVPNRWKRQRSSMVVNMALGNHTAQLGADAILNFDVNLSIDGEKLTQEEIDELVNTDSNLFLFRGRWVELKQNELHSCLLAYESLLSNHKDGISLAEAMRAYLSPNTLVADTDANECPEITLDNEGWLAGISNNNCEELFNVDVPSESFTATLRRYQSSGVRWLNIMRRMGLGACLSDDMGLGKTVQAIAVLEQIRHLNGNPCLIVIPASLLQNWQYELTRFAPFIKFRILHSSYGSMDISNNEDTNVFITTYAMLARLPRLKTITWECIILDEAQAIKNPQTLQSKSAKQLKAKFRIAMTGTPIENSITDLWSIFEFLNPRLLGSSADILASTEDPDVLTNKLKRFVRPFILRRLKTDKTIISDLPEKIEMKSYCHLTQKQAILYKQITNTLSEEISSTYGIERRGLVLSSILRLKQICNHPNQYTGNGAYLPTESGKFMRLTEICTNIKNRHERVLIFTQFKEMCDPLFNTLRDLFGREGLIIHGSTSVAERGAIVEKFNDPNEYIPYIVLSLRAGGVGLNLTAANHVIHFDRWWNPAVENQATDRAFRIGQTSNVIVHKLICTGTLEEKIDRLIDKKSDMAMDIVESDVKLTELSNDELLSLLHMEEM